MLEDRPDWVRLLLLIYGSDMLSIRWSPDDSDTSPPDRILSVLNVDSQEFDVLAGELQTQGLLKESDGRLRLTDRGFAEARRHYSKLVNERSSVTNGKWLSLGILLVGFLALVAGVIEQLALSPLALVFLVLVAAGAVGVVVLKAFGKDSEEMSSGAFVSENSGFTGTVDNDKDRYQSKISEYDEPEREKSR